MEPFRAFVGDMLPSYQRTKGFAMQSFFIGTGAVIASALPYVLTEWIGIENTAPVGRIPPSVKYSFYIGAVIFISAVSVTVFKTKEYSPLDVLLFKADGQKFLDEIPKERLQLLNISREELNIIALKGQKELTPIERDKRKLIDKLILDLEKEQEKVAEAEDKENLSSKKTAKCLRTGLILFILGTLVTVLLSYIKVEQEVYILSVGLGFFGVMEIIAWLYQRSKRHNGLVSIMNDLNYMPKTMAQLAFVQFFSWFALFAMWIYTTAGVTSHIYGTSDTQSILYNEGANWVGVCFAIYNGAAAIFAFLLMYLAKLTNRKITHMISLVIGGISYISIYFIQDPDLLVIPFIGIGLVWASILAMPYAILTGALPANKMGVYMGIFNFFLVIPQIVAASILGFFVKTLFEGEAILALITAGVSLIIAGVAIMFVTDKD